MPVLTKTTAAALAVEELLAFPEFGDERPGDFTDFNDLARYWGSEAVRACIANAKAPARAEVRSRSDNVHSTAGEGRIR
jgi:putative DNA primase/helicase